MCEIMQVSWNEFTLGMNLHRRKSHVWSIVVTLHWFSFRRFHRNLRKIGGVVFMTLIACNSIYFLIKIESLENSSERPLDTREVKNIAYWRIVWPYKIPRILHRQWNSTEIPKRTAFIVKTWNKQIPQVHSSLKPEPYKIFSCPVYVWN